MWNAHNDSPLSPRLSDDTFHPWWGPARPHALYPSRHEEDAWAALGMVLGMVIGTGVCLVVLAVELLVVGGLWGVRLVRRAGRAWWQSLAVVLVLGGLLAGCEGMSRQVLLLTGCDASAIDAGYCQMPREVKR